MIGRTNTGGGGGVSSSFSVVGGTTRPAKPAQNMIWANTEHNITEYVFSATEPTTPSEGMLWIIISNNSVTEMSVALGGEWVKLYFINAKQYIDGAWVDKTVKSYQDGLWVDWWNGELFDNGNQYIHITGGWVRIFYNKDTDSATIGTDSIVIESHKGNGTVCVGLKNFNPALLAQYSNLAVECTMARDDSTGYMSIGVVPDYDLSTSISNEWTSKTDIKTGTTSTAVAYHDISSIDVGYPMITGFNAKVTITKVWLE